MPEIRIEPRARSMDLSAAGGRSHEHEAPRLPRRRCRTARRGGGARSGSCAAMAGGGVVALVTADLESHLVAVDTSSGRIVKRIPVSPGPRSIESNGFGQVLVAHTAFGRVSHPRCRHAHGRRAGGRARGAALHGDAPDGAARLRQRLEARRGRGRSISSRRRIVGRVARSRPGASPLVERGRPAPLGRARHEGRRTSPFSTSPPPTTPTARADDPAAVSRARRRLGAGDEHVWVTSGARSEIAVYARNGAARRCCGCPRAPRRSTSRSSAPAPTSRAARTDRCACTASTAASCAET